MIAKIEHTDQGANPRFIVTNLRGPSQSIYDGTYCARGEMENRIKEQQLGLFADRTSSHYWWANQFPAAARLTGLCADGRDPPAGAQGHEAGPGPGDDDPPEAAQDRRGDPA